MEHITASSYNLIALLISASFLFIVLSSPSVYIYMNKKFEKYNLTLSDEDGRPYAYGLLLQAFIFFILLSILLSKNLLYSSTMFLFVLFCFIIL